MINIVIMSPKVLALSVSMYIHTSVCTSITLCSAVLVSATPLTVFDAGI